MLMCMLSVNAYSQDESLYLASLNAEANGLRLDKSTQKPVGSPVVKLVDVKIRGADDKNLGGAGTNLLDGLTFQQFEEVLKDNFMGSFYYYKHLESGQKDKVYSVYLRYTELDVIRRSILNEFKNI